MAFDAKAYQKEYQKLYRLEHPELFRIASQKWRKKYPNKVKEYNEKYRKENVEKRKEYYLRTRDKRIEYTKRYSREHRKELNLRNRKRVLKKYYGLSVEDYQVKFDNQKGLCAICGNSQIKNLVVDHNHQTGKVRGLLCRSCNLALGNLKESLKSAEGLVKYINSHVEDKK